MAKNGFKIIDSDMHIMEPPDLWQRYIDSKYRDRAPRGVTSSNVRDLRMVYPDGREWARTTTRQNDSARGHNFDRNQEAYRSDAATGGWRHLPRAARTNEPRGIKAPPAARSVKLAP